MQEPEHFTSQATANDMALKAYNRALMLSGPGNFPGTRVLVQESKRSNLHAGEDAMDAGQCQLDSHSWTIRQLDSCTIVQLDSHSRNFSILH
jgi:hypothetical protein